MFCPLVCVVNFNDGISGTFNIPIDHPIAAKITAIIINDDHDYMVYNKLLELDCLTPEENKVIQDALLLYEKNGKVAEDDFELIDKMITESDLNKLENMFKNNNNKRR